MSSNLSSGSVFYALALQLNFTLEIKHIPEVGINLNARKRNIKSIRRVHYTIQEVLF